MKYKGFMYCYGNSEPYGTVTDAVLTRSRISIDWEDPEGGGHLEAGASESDQYEGVYTVPGVRPTGRFDLKCYMAGDEVLLFGTWSWPATKDEGSWAFLLSPRE